MPSRTKPRLPRTTVDFDRAFMDSVLPMIADRFRGSDPELGETAALEAVLKAMATAADEIVAKMIKVAPRSMQRERSRRRGFEQRLAQTWARGFDALAHLCAVYSEYGAE